MFLSTTFTLLLNTSRAILRGKKQTKTSKLLLSCWILCKPLFLNITKDLSKLSHFHTPLTSFLLFPCFLLPGCTSLCLCLPSIWKENSCSVGVPSNELTSVPPCSALEINEFSICLFFCHAQTQADVAHPPELTHLWCWGISQEIEWLPKPLSTWTYSFFLSYQFYPEMAFSCAQCWAGASVSLHMGLLSLLKAGKKASSPGSPYSLLHHIIPSVLWKSLKSSS